MNHPHPIIQLLNLADPAITVAQFRHAVGQMLPLDELRDIPYAAVDNPAPKGMLAAKALPKAIRKPSKPRVEKAPSTEVEEVLDTVVTCLLEHGSGMRAERLRAHTNSAHLLGRALKLGVNSGKLRREGEKRATTYFLV